jgi:PAS domain S-box-containing protein
MEPSDPDEGKRVYRFGIRRKVIASFVVAYAVLTGSFLYIIVVTLHRLVEDEVVKAVRHKATNISAVVSERLAGRDKVFLAEYLGQVLEASDIEYARIEGPGGDVLAEAGLSGKYAGPAGEDPRGSERGRASVVREIGRQKGLLHEKGHSFSVVSPVTFQGIPVGRIHLGLNTMEVNHRLAAVTYRALEIAAVTILAGIALTCFLYRQMRSAMKELVDTTFSIAKGHLDRRATVTTGDELEELAGAVNRMARAVAERERELVLVRNTMVAMFEGITEGIAYIGRDYRIIHANRAYATFQGQAGEVEVVGRKCHELFWDGPHDCETCPGRIALETGRSAEAEREVLRGNGERQVFRIQAYPVVLPVEGPAGFVEYVSEVTLQRKMEEELKRHATRLEEIVRERTLRLREAQEQMIHKEKIAALGQMAAGVAHEIGNPLSSLSSIVRSFTADPGREGGREEKLRVMQEQVDRIARIVRELVDFSRPSSFGKNLMHVNEVLRTAMGIARYDERFKGVHVITSLDHDIPALKLDGDQLLQVFLNILLNAADAMRGSGTLTVSSRRMNHSVAVRFGDSGPGIAEESLSRIFEPFFTTKDVGKGAGLGLSVSYGIIQGMGGSIRASNQAGRGALFTVEIPLPDTGGDRA